MATFEVTITAYFSDSVEVEIDDEHSDNQAEIERIAVAEFENTWLPLSSIQGVTYVWDSIDVEMVEELS
jgi:hypothetical protein